MQVRRHFRPMLRVCYNRNNALHLRPFGPAYPYRADIGTSSAHPFTGPNPPESRYRFRMSDFRIRERNGAVIRNPVVSIPADSGVSPGLLASQRRRVLRAPPTRRRRRALRPRSTLAGGHTSAPPVRTARFPARSASFQRALALSQPVHQPGQPGQYPVRTARYREDVHGVPAAHRCVPRPILPVANLRAHRPRLSLQRRRPTHRADRVHRLIARVGHGLLPLIAHRAEYRSYVDGEMLTSCFRSAVRCGTPWRRCSRYARRRFSLNFPPGPAARRFPASQPFSAGSTSSGVCTSADSIQRGYRPRRRRRMKRDSTTLYYYPYYYTPIICTHIHTSFLPVFLSAGQRGWGTREQGSRL
jgi:hypothetical protein